jgi:ubiquinone/menaquinone biosynthesis C-methylase UbiE
MKKFEKKWKEIWINKKINTKKHSIEDLIKFNGFSDHASISKRLYKKFISKLVKKLRINKQSDIFEFGCGTGLNLFLLKKFCKSVSGYDYSDNLIRIAQSILKKKNISAKKKVFNNKYKKYDICIINSVFQYISKKNIELILNKLANITKNKIYIGDIYDANHRKNFIKEKKKFYSNIDEYNKKYKYLNYTFIKKSFFKKYAKKSNMKIVYLKNMMEHDNKKYRYNVILNLK